MLYVLLRRKGTNNFFKEDKMQKALSQFDAGLEEVKSILVNLAFRLDRIPDDLEVPELNAELDHAVTDLSDACALLDAKRVVFYHEANVSRG
jgi:hypothetical protein